MAYAKNAKKTVAAMNKVKRAAILILAVILVLCIAGCKQQPDTKTNGKLQIVATIFPAYDFALQICKDIADVSILIPPGSESHSYEPSAQDIITIQNCDLFIYTGGLSDTWVDEILSSMDEPVKAIKMMDCVDAVEEVITEGMQEEEETGGIEYDEHVWTSPRNAIRITEAIYSAVCEIDSPNASVYLTNYEAYIGSLEELDAEFTDFFATVENKTLIFGDRFPFRYFADEYGLKYYAAFPGCATETETSAQTIAFLINKVKEEKISTVFYVEFSNQLIADSIAEATGANTALLHSCHNVTKDDMNKGVTYLSLMQQNLMTLKEAMR